MGRPHAYHADRMDCHVVKNSCLKWLCNRNDFQSQISKTNNKKQNKNNDEDDRLWLQYQTESFKVVFLLNSEVTNRQDKSPCLYLNHVFCPSPHIRLSKVVLKYNSTHMNQGLDKGLNSACSACPIQKWILLTVSTKVHVDKVINWSHPCIKWASTARGDTHASLFPSVTFTRPKLSAPYAWEQFESLESRCFDLTTSDNIAMVFTVLNR